jgi:Tat protein secretion system quality control protein TatD with DNase activity
LFREHCRLALRIDLPLVIHCRTNTDRLGQAEVDCRSLLLSEVGRDYPIMVHSFAGDEEEMTRWTRYSNKVVFSLGGLVMREVHTAWSHVRTEPEILPAW